MLRVAKNRRDFVAATAGYASVEHNHYHLTCIKCGHTGAMVRRSDDFGRWEATVTGFDDTVVYAEGPVFGKCTQCGALGTIEAELLRSA